MQGIVGSCAPLNVDIQGRKMTQRLVAAFLAVRTIQKRRGVSHWMTTVSNEVKVLSIIPLYLALTLRLSLQGGGYATTNCMDAQGKIKMDWIMPFPSLRDTIVLESRRIETGCKIGIYKRLREVAPVQYT